MHELAALIVDDEPLARREIEHLLTPFPMIRVAAEASDAREAIEYLRQKQLQVVFLDINMPGQSGMKVATYAATLRPHPYVVFVTAYEEFAVEAFENSADDYLLKPVLPERFGLGMSRLLEHFYTMQLDKAPPARRLLDLFPVRTSADSIKLVPLEEISVFEAERQYCRVHSRNESLLTCGSSLGEIEETLPRPPFARVHRSFIVNLTKVQSIHTIGSSKYELVVSEGRCRRVPVARRHVGQLKLLLGV